MKWLCSWWGEVKVIHSLSQIQPDYLLIAVIAALKKLVSFIFVERVHMRELEVIVRIYQELISKIGEKGIPVDMRVKSLVGTVQDDPFDTWIEIEIRKALPDTFEVFHSGFLTTPDIIIRDKRDGTIVGLEIKKLIQKANGSDSRGLTIDYNSSLPCGSTMIKVGAETIIIPCFYLFALLDLSSLNIVTLILVDGDFLNYDFDLHKEAKYSNYTEYNHGPYGEGSIRHRKMYTYPNPLNSKISIFHMRKILVAKKADFEKIKDTSYVTEQIIRTDKHNNSFFYYLKDETINTQSSLETLKTLEGIFDLCKSRIPKVRTSGSITMIPLLPPIKSADNV